MYATRAVKLEEKHPDPQPRYGAATTAWENRAMEAHGASQMTRGADGTRFAVQAKDVDHTTVEGATAEPHGYHVYRVALPDGFESYVSQGDKAGPWARALAGLPPE